MEGFALLDRTNLFLVARTVLPPSTRHTLTVAVPNLSALLGATLFFQSSERSGSTTAITKPVLVPITG